MCGSCVEACTMHAIEAFVTRRSITGSSGSQPNPVRLYKKFQIIHQKTSIENVCVGCGMCEKVCLNRAKRPVGNPDARVDLLARTYGPIKRGGRTNLNAQRTLDQIVVGRISQMTDPALDSERHTFDIRAPFGRVLLPSELPLEVAGRQLRLTGSVPSVHWIYPLLLSDMSIDALSTRAWEVVAMPHAPE